MHRHKEVEEFKKKSEKSFDSHKQDSRWRSQIVWQTVQKLYTQKKKDLKKHSIRGFLSVHCHMVKNKPRVSNMGRNKRGR